MKIENIINYSFCHPLTAPAIVPVPEFCFIVSVPSDHLFFTVSKGVSSMWEPQRLSDISPRIAKLLSQQHISHLRSDWVWFRNSKCRSISAAQAEIREQDQSRLSRFTFSLWICCTQINTLPRRSAQHFHVSFTHRGKKKEMAAAEYIPVWDETDRVACGTRTSEKWSVHRRLTGGAVHLTPVYTVQTLTRQTEVAVHCFHSRFIPACDTNTSDGWKSPRTLFDDYY